MKTIKLGITTLLMVFGVSMAYALNNSYCCVEGEPCSYAPKAWKPMIEMREVMKSTFHPMLENNLKPARENATLMLEKAKDLVVATDRPKMFKGDKKDAELNDMLAKAEIYANKVAQNATDEEVKIALSDLHGAFATLVPEKMKEEMHKMDKEKGKTCEH
jgi:hypothetical protein